MHQRAVTLREQVVSLRRRGARQTRIAAALALAALVAAAGTLLAGASASATAARTFGANLNLVSPQSRWTCATLYYASTCTVLTGGAAVGSAAGSFLVPSGPGREGAGTITAFHLKVASPTGQMQILLLQALRRRPPAPQEAACCTVVRATGIFVPRADATTTIRVDWPTEADNAPNPVNGIYAFDLIAVSVGSNVALPVAPYAGASDGFFAPACPGIAGEECFREGGDERYLVTMNATWIPG